MHKRYSSTGFSIVEVLVIVVIIGVLATLVTINYSAFQRNARNSYTETTTHTYIEALKAYLQENNKYPALPVSHKGYACLGEGFDLAGDGSKACLIRPPAQGDPVLESPTFNDALRPYFPGKKLPKASKFTVTIDPTFKFSSGSYSNEVAQSLTTVDGEIHSWFVTYYVEGDAKCKVTPTLTLDYVDTVPGVGFVPHYLSDPPATGYTFKVTPDINFCVIALPPEPKTE